MFSHRLLSSFFLFLVIPFSSCAVPQPLAVEGQEASTEPILASINGQPLDIDEFEQQYTRTSGNAGVIADTLAAYQDFLSRYVDFRIKVLEARQAGYHTDESLVEEIGQYRTQLARPYLMERNVMEPLIREMYARRKEAVAASHILITVTLTASPADTLVAFTKIVAIRDSVLSGSDFGMMAARHSMDPSAKGEPGAPGYHGSLGFFGGGRMVKQFEDQAFSTPVDSVSEVFRTNFGYHVLMVTDKMSMPGDRQLAHILIRARGASAADIADVDQRISRVGTRLSDGDDFEEIASELSDDQNSAQRGGDIGTLSFDAGLPFQFRDAAFSIETIGEYTGPVTTPFGQHFIKYMGETAFGTYEEEYEAMKNRVNSMPRAAEAEKIFAAGLRANLEAWVDSSLVERWVDTMTADSLYRMLATGDLESDVSSTIFLRLDSHELTASEFAEYFSSSRLPNVTGSRARIYAVADRYLDERAVSHEVELLEQRDSSFGKTMQDFRDGLILFTLMEDSIWTAASSDTLGMNEYYAAHSAEYQFVDRVRVISFSSETESQMVGFVETVRSTGIDTALEQAASDSTYSIRTDTTYTFESTGSIYDEVLDMDEGGITDPVSFNRGFVVLFHAGIDPARQMTFREARSQVLNEYQGVVEATLIARLRQKYAVTVFPENLAHVFNKVEVDPEN